MGVNFSTDPYAPDLTAPGSKKRRVRTRGSRRRVVAAVAAVIALIFLGVSIVVTSVSFIPADALVGASDNVALAASFANLTAVVSIAAVLLLLVAWGVRRSTKLLVALVSAAVVTALQVGLVAPLYVASSALPTKDRSLTVLSLNTFTGHADAVQLTAVAQKADVVVLIEATRPLTYRLDDAGFTDRFRYRTDVRLPNEGAKGTVVYSRFPLTKTTLLPSALRNQSVVASVQVPKLGLVSVAGVHPVRPFVGSSDWVREQRLLAKSLPKSGLRVAAGDFNATSNQSSLRTLRQSGWVTSDDAAGSGWTPTWPADRAHVPPVFDIDHVLTAPGLVSTSSSSVRVAGTDHLGLLVRVEAVGS